MSNLDAIWIIDDDGEDHDLVKEIFDELNYKNPLNFFNDAKTMLAALDQEETAPFIILCDVNIRGMDGFQLREKLLEIPNNKFHSVPFIFWSVTASEHQIRKAFDLRAHGFFIKEPTFNDWKTSFIHIVEYWKRSKMPSKEDKPDKPLI